MAYYDEVNLKLKKFRKIFKSSGLTDGKIAQGAASTANNKQTWKNDKVRQLRITNMKKSKLEKGQTVPKHLYDKIYKDSWGPGRKKGYVAKAVKFLHKKGFTTITKSRIHHVLINDLKSASTKQHEKNMEIWSSTYGLGTWEVWTPGMDLLPLYDKVITINQIFPASIIFHVRFKMHNASPKEVRDYLLPYTNGKYITNKKTGRIENGDYIKVRKLKLPFLTTKRSKVYKFTNPEKLRKFVSKLKGKNLNRLQLWGTLHGNQGVHETQKLAGYYFKKTS